MQLSYSAAYHHVFYCTLKSNQINKYTLSGVPLQSTPYSLQDWVCEFVSDIIQL
jgi:hypothetical protein